MVSGVENSVKKPCLTQALREVQDRGLILSRVRQFPSWRASGPRARTGSANGRKERLSQATMLGPRDPTVRATFCP